MDSTVTAYRQTFSTESGKRVLVDILSQAGFFDTNLSTPEEIAVENFAKKILKKSGLCGQVPEHSWLSIDNLDGFGQKLFELAIKD